MEFLNDTVLVDQLPKAEALALQPIEPLYLKVLRWEWLITMLLFGAILGTLAWFIPALQATRWLSLMGGAWLLTGIIWYLLQERSFHTKAYAVREKDVIYRSGWIIQHTRTTPFNRILHSSVTAGPLERKYGIATLVLYTAGPGDTDLRIRGLQEPAAHALKEWITKKIADEPLPE